MKNKIKSLVYQLLTVLVGNTLVFFQPEKAKQLSENGMTLVLDNRMSIMERLMRSAILNKLEKRKDFDTLAKLHKNFHINRLEILHKMCYTKCVTHFVLEENL